MSRQYFRPTPRHGYLFRLVLAVSVLSTIATVFLTHNVSATDTEWDIDTGYLAHLIDKTSGHEGISAYALSQTPHRSEISPATLTDGVRYNDMPDHGDDGLTKKVKSALSFGAEFAWKEHVTSSPWRRLMLAITEEDKIESFGNQLKAVFASGTKIKAGAMLDRFVRATCKAFPREDDDCSIITSLVMRMYKHHQMWTAYAAYRITLAAGVKPEAYEPDVLEWAKRVNATRKAILVESLAANSHYGCRQHWHGMAPVAFQQGMFFRFTNKQVAGQILTQVRKWWIHARGECAHFVQQKSDKELDALTERNTKQLIDTVKVGMAAHDPHKHKAKQSLFAAIKGQAKELFGSEKTVDASGDFEIGQILHVIQDSWSAPHALRNGPGCGEILTFQGYGLQDADKHGADDHNPNFSGNAKKQGLKYRQHLWHCAEQQSESILKLWSECKASIRKHRHSADHDNQRHPSACDFPEEQLKKIFKVNKMYAGEFAGGTRDIYEIETGIMARKLGYDRRLLAKHFKLTYPEGAPPEGCGSSEDTCDSDAKTCTCQVLVLLPPYGFDMVHQSDSTHRMPSREYQGPDDADYICSHQS
jgi:hypothetical protein